MYLQRHIEGTLKESIEEFPVIALIGPRQVGKTTLLQELFGDDFEYISLDELSLRTQAQRDPALFLRNHPGRLIIDEIQHAPQLLPEIKMEVDRAGKPGRFILTGSQQFQVMRGLRESLAGRVLLLNLHPMTVFEKAGLGSRDHWLSGVLSGGEIDDSIFTSLPSSVRPLDFFVWGGLPGLLPKSEKFIAPFFESYVRTYIERDLPNQFDVRDGVGLVRFLSLLAPQTSREINKSQAGRELSISPPTAQRWLGWLRDSLIWHEHPPFHGNIIRRVSKHPKGFLFDTGLCCHLLHIHGRRALESHPIVGSLFETAIRLEFEAVIGAALLPARCYHWRTPYGVEVDIVVDHEGGLYAFECKWASSPSGDDLRGLRGFRDQYGKAVALCAVIVPYGRPMLLEEGIYQIPWFLRA